MAERRIEWSIEVRNDLFRILKFYRDRNKSNAYSLKLNNKISKTLLTLSENPNIGLKTRFKSVKTFTIGDYQIIYEIYDQFILVILIWDCRRNPNDKRIGKRISKIK